MLVHVAIFRWKAGTPADAVTSALADVRALEQKIPGVQAIYCGENFSKWAEGYTHAVVVVAQDQQALDAYRKHPDHEAVAAKIEAMEDRGIGVDFHDK
jgi:hypothetical protein